MGIAWFALASVPLTARSIPLGKSAQNPVGLPKQLLIDMFNLGSGLGEYRQTRRDAVAALARAVREGRPTPTRLTLAARDLAQRTIRLARLLLHQEDPSGRWRQISALV